MATPGQIKDVISAVVESVPVNNLTYEMAQYFIGRKKWLGTEMKKIFSVDNSRADLIADWRAFYRNLGIDCDLSDVIIPDNPGGSSRVIIMAQGITPQSAYDFCAKNFPCWKYTNDDLDKIVTSDRIAKDGSYAIRVRDRVEADEELKNRSYNDLKQQGIAGITLEEREIFELKFFKEIGKHLDIQNVTLCTGSRYSDGDVPYVFWGGGELRVNWFSPVHAYDSLRSRQTVSS